MHAMRFPACPHVLIIIHSDGDVMPPFFFSKGVNMMKEADVDLLDHNVTPCQVEVSAGTLDVLQQTDTPVHTLCKIGPATT